MSFSCEGCPLQNRPKVPPRYPLKDIGQRFGLDTQFASGAPVIVGEAPGRQEVKVGLPFVGKAGQLLAAVLQDVGIDDSELFITNTCLCHPERNATPTEEMIEACRPRLMTELEEIKASKVLLMGNTAIQGLLPGSKGVTKIRGVPVWHDDLDCYLLPTFHPAAILRNPELMRDFADDLKTFKKLPENVLLNEPPSDLTYNFVETIEGLKKVKHAITFASDIVTCDLETTGVDRMNDRILSVGFATAEDEIWIIPESTFRRRVAMKIMRSIFRLRGVQWVTQNGPQFDAQFINREFLKPHERWDIHFDTLLAHYALDERQGVHGLKSLVGRYFMATNYGIDLGAMMKKGIENWTEEDYDELYWYHALDCHYTYRLYYQLKAELEDSRLERVHDEILLPAAKALSECERTGVRVDVDYLERLDHDLETELREILAALREASGRDDFNPNSHVQVKEVLIERLKLLPKGSSTDKETLESIPKHPVVEGIHAFRLKSKLRSTYVKGLLDTADEDQRVHADFLLFGTATGRLSSRHPNLQNIPQLAGPLIRRAFVARPGWTFAEADYSQLELRVAAYYSRDEFLLRAYHEGLDVHTLVASEIYGVPLDRVTFDQRYTAKYVDFGIIYGRGAYSLAKGELKCSPNEAQRYIDNFLSRFEKLHEWIRAQHRIAVRQGYVETPLGRRRRFPLILNDNVGEIERQAVNTPIQSLASDINLMSLTRLNQILDPDDAIIVSTVHDSILFEIRTEVLEKMLRLITTEMAKTPMLSEFTEVVPLKADVKIGTDWGSAKEIDIDEYFTDREDKETDKSRRQSHPGTSRRGAKGRSRKATRRTSKSIN